MGACPKCKTQIGGAVKFCPECGEKITPTSNCPTCAAEVTPGAKFCPECGVALVFPAPPAVQTSTPSVAIDAKRVALGLYRTLGDTYGSHILERFRVAARERSLVRRMTILDPGAIEGDVDRALYDMVAEVPRALDHVGVKAGFLDTTPLFTECKALVGPVTATLTSLRAILAEAGVAAQLKGSGGMVTGAILGSRSNSLLGSLAATGVGAAYDQVEQDKRVQAVAQRYNEMISRLEGDFKEAWDRIFDRISASVGAMIRTRLPNAASVKNTLDTIADDLAGAKEALASSDGPKAITLSANALALYPDDLAALVVSSGAHLLCGQTEEAARAIDRVLAIEPKRGDALLLKAAILDIKVQASSAPQERGEVRAVLEQMRGAQGDYRCFLKVAEFCKKNGYDDFRPTLMERVSELAPFVLPQCAVPIREKIERICAETSADGGKTFLGSKFSVKEGSKVTEAELQNVRYTAGELLDDEIMLCAGIGGVGAEKAYCVITNQRLLHYVPGLQPACYQVLLRDIRRFEISVKVMIFVFLKVSTRGGEVVERPIGAPSRLRALERAMNEVVLPSLGKWVGDPGEAGSVCAP